MFSLFWNYLPLQMTWPFILTTRILFTQGCYVWLKLAQRFLRRRFWNFIKDFSLFHNYLLLEKDEAVHLNKLEFPAPRMFSAKFDWNKPFSSWEEIFWVSSTYFCYFVISSPWKRAWFFIWTNLNAFTQGCIAPSMVEIGQVVPEKKIFLIWKVYRLTDGQTDAGG